MIKSAIVYFIFLVAAGLIPVALTAQVQNPIVFPGVPTGACGPPNTAVNSSNGDFYTCAASAWVKVGSSGGGGGGTGTAPQQAIFSATNTITGQNKPIYDTRDWMTCDGSTDTSSGLNTLLSTIGTDEATIRFIGTTTPSAACRIGNTFFGPNITLDFSGGGAITLISSTTPPGGAAFGNGTSVECGASSTCTLPALSTTVGNVLTVMDAPYPGFTFKITKIRDDCNDFFIHVQQSTANQPRNQGMWVASSIHGGNCTIIATANGSLTTNMMMAQQWSGLGPVASLDATASTNVTASTMSATVATTAGSLLIAYGGQPFTFPETCTQGAGYIQPAGIVGQSSPNGSICMEYALSSAGGSTTATQTISSSASHVFSLVALKPGNATATIWGGIHNPDMHQIFFNGDGATGHGVIDFTGSAINYPVYPEWWGATGNDTTGAVNTPAIQAAIWAAYGCGPLLCRTNQSNTSLYNREIHFSNQYTINAELNFFHVNGFHLSGTQRLSSGIIQGGTNKRIINGDGISYGVIENMTFSTQATQDTSHPLVSLDWSGTQTPTDLKPQFIDFEHVGFGGSGVAAIGLLIAGSGGAAQGSNVNCWDCNFVSFSQAAYQIGTSATPATNGVINTIVQGDIQGSPQYGVAVYGGNVFIRDMSFENGFTTQVGWDIYCEAGQYFCVVDNVRSEGRRLVAGSNLVVKNSKTVNQALFPTPGTTLPPGTIIMGSIPGGDGRYYRVTANAGPFGGLGTNISTVNATGGSATTLVNTNQTMSGSNTIKTFVVGETVTQAVTGSTGTVISGLTSTGTITGSSNGQFLTGETITQAVTGITAVVLSPSPGAGTANLLANNFSGTADNSHTWTGGTTGKVYTPTAAPTFSVLVMTISAATGSPDNSHAWTGGTSAAVYIPTTVPVGPGYTINAFTGYRATVTAGTNAGCYGVITSNTVDTLTITAWLTQFQFVLCTQPDNTSFFIVEPNWGTQFTSAAGMVWVDQNENGLEGPSGTGLSSATIENVDIPGDKISINGPNVILRNVTVTRNDWAILPSGNLFASSNTLNNVLDVYNRQTVASSGQSRYQNYSFPHLIDAGTITYSGPLQQNMGTKPLVWSVGSGGGAPKSADDVWIGGRSDPNSKNDHSRAILEYGGMLGRPSAFGTNQNGTATQISGGLPTGSGVPGNIEFWMAPGGGGSSATPQSGALVASVVPKGITTRRFSVDNSTTLTSGAFTIGAGWGSTAAIAITVTTSKDPAYVVTITTGGTGIVANPTLQITFADGTWTNVPACYQIQTGGNDIFGDTTVTARSATSYTYQWAGTPTTGKTYEFTQTCTGT
jgi:hypothetical protein